MKTGVTLLLLLARVLPCLGDAGLYWMDGARAAPLIMASAEAIVNSATVRRAMDGNDNFGESATGGWSFLGRLDDAWAIFVLATPLPPVGLLCTARIVTGVGGRHDARVSAIRLWATDAPLPSLPPEWYDKPDERVPEHYGWHQIVPTHATIAHLGESTGRQAAVYNNRIFLAGEPACCMRV